MKKTLFTLALALFAIASHAKTLVVYYSFTNNVQTIVNDLSTQIDADVVRIEPTEKGVDYAANGYAIGSALISAIRSNPNDANSYPAIDPVNVDLSNYDVIIIGTPLWWSNMAAPMQTFLFQHGSEMAGKHIGLIVSSASSSIDNVVADAKRLIPEGNFTQSLWIRSGQVTNCHTLTANWLNNIRYDEITAIGSLKSSTSATPQAQLSAQGLNISGAFDHVTVYNSKGQQVLASTQSATARSFQPDNYIVQIMQQGKRYTQKQIVK